MRFRPANVIFRFYSKRKEVLAICSSLSRDCAATFAEVSVSCNEHVQIVLTEILSRELCLAPTFMLSFSRYTNQKHNDVLFVRI